MGRIIRESLGIKVDDRDERVRTEREQNFPIIAVKLLVILDLMMSRSIN